jgi:adenylate cyclase
MRYGGHDPGVCGLAQGALTLWFLGYADRALTDSQRALRLAEQVHHPPSLAHALNWAAMLHQFRREPEAVRAHTDVLLSLAAEQGLGMFLVMGGLLHGWALAVTGNPQEGLVQLQEGFHRLQAIGVEGLYGYFKSLMAEAYARAGLREQELEELDAGLTYTEKIGDRFWEAELYRLKGEFLREQAGTARTWQGAEEHMIQALPIARNQGTKSLELRAAMSLAKLWQSQNKRQDAYELLVPVYNWFTEGFDTADLQEAKALLDELA